MTSKHILFTGAPVWSHIRPFCILAARLVKQRPDVSLTLVLSPQVLKKTDEELSVELGEGDLADVRKRIRVFSSIASASANPMEGIQQMAEAYSNVYGLLVAGKPVTCQATGTLFEPLPPPTVVILDFICAVEYNVMRQVSGISIPIVGWMMGHAPSIIRIFGPEAMGGYGDLGAKVDVEAARLGVTAEEVGDKIYQETTGKVIKLPGIPEMYDWEFFPQLQLFEGTATPFLRLVSPLLRGYNAILASNTQSWEGDGIDAIREWLSEWNKEVYAVGPLLPSGYGTLQQSNRGVDNLEVFLNSMQAKYGNKSVVLFSLGTLFWPKDNRYLEEIIDAFIENSIPLVLSCSSPFAKLHDSDEVKKKLEASGIGFFMTWCPQQYVLSHPATGWFFTHGGHNSVTESLGSGIPMIVWPFGADQPATALHLSSLGIGIELLEVRTGIHASKPLRRNGKSAVGTHEAVGKEIREVINLCKSHQGTEMREKAQSMKRKFQKAWEVDGEATKALNLFLDRFVAR